MSSCLITLSFGQEPVNDKTYNFRYSTGNEGPAQIWREERREADGTVVGKYGYVDPNGEERVVEYRANPDTGFQASGDTGPDNAALRVSQQLAAEHQRDVARVMNDWNKAAARTPVTAARSAPAPSSPWSQKQSSRNSWNSPPPPPPQQPKTNWNAAPVQSAPVQWPTLGNNAQWNNAWQNFNWNENNARVMADWSQPQKDWSQPQRRTSWEAPSQPAAWNSWNNNNNNQQDFMRRSSPAAAFRQQRQQTSWNDQPAWNDQSASLTRRSGHSSTTVSQDPFSFSFGIDHNAK